MNTATGTCANSFALGFVESMDASHRTGLATLLGPLLLAEYNLQNGYPLR